MKMIQIHQIATLVAYLYVNRSIYLPTPKIIPTPKTETRSMYLPPAPKPKPSTEKAKSGFVKSKYIF